MRNRITLFVLISFAITGNLSAQLAVSGLLDSTVSLRAGAGDAPAFSYGVEEYANLRIQARLRDNGTFFGAFNFIAAAGDNALGLAGLGFFAGDNFIAGIELERLYFRLSSDAVGFDGGLLRLPFGYGQVWGSSDFLNPKNPLKPDARPRAVLGTGLSWFPKDELKLLGFGTAPRDPFSRSGEGGLVGLSMDHHWDKASLQLLYAFESPKADSKYGIHRAGVSVKAELEIALIMDALYTYNHEAGTELDGLSFSLGADYSFFEGDLIVLATYLYNGKTSSTAFNPAGNLFGLNNENYLYTSFTWRFNDYTNMGVALISSFDDVSFTPVISLNHDLFQGVTLTISAQIPLDRNLFSGDGNRGELGPLPPLAGNMGRYFDCSAKLRLRF